MQKNTPKQTPRFFRIAQFIGIVGVTLLVLNFVYQLWHLHSTDETKTPAALCNLQIGSCSKNLPNNQILTLSLTPTPITSDATSSVTVTLVGITPDHVAVLVFPYPATEPASKPVMLTPEGSGVYVGKVFIKKTSRPTQKWVAMVVLQNGTQEISAPFQFDVNN